MKKKRMEFMIASNLRDMIDSVNEKGITKDDIILLFLTGGIYGEGGYTLVYYI